MRRIRLFIEYDGTNYAGWQRQENAYTVQQALEENLYQITGEKIAVHGSGRTDSGVHALAQVAHFDTNARMSAEKFAYALNAGLPRDIRVTKSEEADESFHARFSAKRKHYRYTIDNAEHASALFRSFRLHVHAKLDVAAMREAAQALVGTHDFCAFMAAGSTLENTVRTVYRSEISQQGSLIHYDIEGNGFLYNMVRIIAGTLLEIGFGKYPASHMAAVVQGRERANAGATAPAHALTLVRVDYPESAQEQQRRAAQTLADNLSEDHQEGDDHPLTVEELMKEALAEAELALCEGEIPVGSVVARGGVILARGRNARETTADPTAHAEIVALRRAAERTGDWRLNGCTLYVTLEPCPMCAGAIANSRVSRVVFGAFDPLMGCCGSKLDLCGGDFGGAQVLGGVLRAQCEEILSRHFARSRAREV